MYYEDFPVFGILAVIFAVLALFFFMSQNEEEIPSCPHSGLLHYEQDAGDIEEFRAKGWQNITVEVVGGTFTSTIVKGDCPQNIK